MPDLQNSLGHLAVNLRRDVDECEICTPKAGGCNCRGRSFSEDFGLTWSPMELGGEFAIPKCFSKKVNFPHLLKLDSEFEIGETIINSDWKSPFFLKLSLQPNYFKKQTSSSSLLLT